MLRTIVSYAAAMAAAVSAALSGPAAAQELALERVMLSAGGVGYFEYEAEVDGDAVLPLSVRLDQVDDVLKSIAVYDDTGTAGTIRLAGREPLEQIFRDLPFGADALQSPVALLNALPGAEIRATGQREIAGQLVHVVPEETVLPGRGGSVTRHRVTVLSDDGMQSFVLEEAESVIFTDPALRAQIEGALDAISTHRTRDRRTLEIVSRGSGKRKVRIGYVVAAPLWKASYRLTLGGDAANTARLQGWAVLENMSGQDWNGVELTIVSGNPVTFRQALYTAYYVDRPEVPVEVLGRVLPKPDTGAVDLEGLATGEYREEFRRSQRATPQGQAPAGTADDAPREAEGGVAAMAKPESATAPTALVPPPSPSQARILAAASDEAATQVTFRVPYPVTVATGQSLMIPIIDREIPARRVALYQPATHDRHPLAAVRLSNDGETGLPPGVLTLYETGPAGAGYVGDAQLATLPSGDERLLSFALDQKSLVDREVRTRQEIGKARIVRGVLELTYAQEQRTIYRLKAPAAEARDVLIEHPRMTGWTLRSPAPEEVELADEQYRIPFALKPGERAELEVVMTRPRLQQVALLDLRAPQFMQYVREGGLSRPVREALERMAGMRETIDGHERRLQALEQDRNTIHREQQRIRDNLARVPRDSDLHRRYLEKLGEQEDEMERLLAASETTREALEASRNALADYIRSLDI